MTDYMSIEALRKQGLSYQQIGDHYGITKDAARGIHTRGREKADPLDGLDGSVPRLAGADDAVAGERVPVPYVGFSMGYFDLEASGLNGSYGFLLTAACAHAMEGDEWTARIDDPHLRNRKDPTDDSKLAVAIRDHLLTHDIIVSWNGKRGYNSKGRSGFDIPMLNARLIQPGNEQRIVGRYIKHIDLLKEIRRSIELHSFRLEAVQEFLALNEEKNRILPTLWRKAMAGDAEALDYIALHNIKDVRLTRLVFHEMNRLGLLERPSW